MSPRRMLGAALGFLLAPGPCPWAQHHGGGPSRLPRGDASSTFGGMPTATVVGGLGLELVPAATRSPTT